MKRILTTLSTKWPKYFIEAIVIVASILGAYALDSWNEDRKEKVQEVKYLRNLRIDLQTDLTNLDTMTTDRKSKVESALTLLEMQTTPSNKEEVSQYYRLIWDVFGWSTFTPTTNTIDELIGSGNLSILSDDSVKWYIMSIKPMNQELVHRREHMRREYDHYLYDRSNSIQPVIVGYDLRSYLLEDDAEIKLSEDEIKTVSKKAKVFLDDLTVRNGLTLAVLNNSGIAGQYSQMISQREKLIAKIDFNLSDQSSKE